MPYTVKEKGAARRPDSKDRRPAVRAAGDGRKMSFQTKSLVGPQGALGQLFGPDGTGRRMPSAPAVLCRTVMNAE